ncbi:ATP-binding cassette domain-containing protein [Cognatiyoonia sp. IB215182]|uniref:thiamine ABC transporter ATP-binding protein n=1 Tax=Cognatiyoonia sp. IB215182 TaxID=3097353 RepID=UPI002A12C341|nr:ATP-binding cassette domain-containing protein [Cognatiyoonia sp. IB215182]MDX8353164.1 ATP-binding cassette domain-containing protein [Cognatiyoonia sp. IB215182]
MLTCKALELRQGDFTLQADLAFTPGQVTALIGPSGAGKSTLLAALAGFLAPESGQVLWERQDLTRTAPGARPTSVLFQDNNLFPHLTIGQNVGLALRPHLRLTTDEKAKVSDVLAQVGLDGFEARKPAALSGGQQSRAALARVLLADRPVVLLDEPFAALGPGLKDEMLDLVQGHLRAAGRTLIMVTHDPADAKRIADQVVLVAGGIAAPPVQTETLFANPPQALTDYLGAG